MIRTLCASILLLICTSVNAQKFPSEIWHEGKLVLIEGDTIRGHIKYDLEKDLVQYTQDRSIIKAYTARKLIYFEIFDGTVDKFRQFYVLPFSARSNYAAPFIFELVHEGRRMSLLSRESIEYQVTNYPYTMSGTYTRLVLTYTYFFLDSEGSIERFNGKRGDLVRIMNKKGAEMKRYIKVNKIRPEKRPDLLRTVIHYNSLFEKS